MLGDCEFDIFADRPETAATPGALGLAPAGGLHPVFDVVRHRALAGALHLLVDLFDRVIEAVTYWARGVGFFHTDPYCEVALAECVAVLSEVHDVAIGVVTEPIRRIADSLDSIRRQ